MKKYTQVDISGDVGLRICGEEQEELFSNAAGGMYDLITDASGIKETEKQSIILVSNNTEDLLVKWLNELVFLFDAYRFVGITYDIKLEHMQKPDDTGDEQYDALKLKADISGGTFNQERNERRLLIKAATYHDLSVKKTGSGWEAVVVFDI